MRRVRLRRLLLGATLTSIWSLVFSAPAWAGTNRTSTYLFHSYWHAMTRGGITGVLLTVLFVVFVAGLVYLRVKRALNARASASTGP